MKIASIGNYEQYKVKNTNFKGTVVNNEALNTLVHISNLDGKIGFKNILQTIPKVKDGLVFEITQKFYDTDEYGIGDGVSGECYHLYKKSEQDPNPKLPIFSIDSNEYPYYAGTIWLSLINDKIRAEYPDLFSSETKDTESASIIKLLAKV